MPDAVAPLTALPTLSMSADPVQSAQLDAAKLVGFG